MMPPSATMTTTTTMTTKTTTTTTTTTTTAPSAVISVALDAPPPPPPPPTPSLLLLPSTPLTFIAEGGANVLFRFPSSSSLLRLKKTLASSAPNALAFAYLSTVAFPLFPPHLLVKTELVAVPKELIQRGSDMLKRMEAAGQRVPKRTGMYLDEGEKHALFVKDMSPQTADEVLVEFKPKWVVQSKTAPPDAGFCRTCALRRCKKGKSKRGFCPLDLASEDPKRVERAVGIITNDDKPVCKAVTEWVLESGLMKVLRELQERLDTKGPLNAEEQDTYGHAMTVRDCTLFLRVDRKEERVMDAGVGDLDLKTGKGGKGRYWRETEERLIREGWYVAQEGDERCLL